MGLTNKLSSSDMDKVRQSRNTPEYEPGFEDDSFESGDDGLDALFGDDDDFFSSDFGEGSSTGADTGIGAIPNTNQLSPFNNNQQTQAVQEKDTLDRAFESGEKAIVGVGHIAIDLFKSIKNRNIDDIAYYCRNVIITSVIVAGVSVVVGIIGIASGIRFISFAGLPTQMLIAGIVTLGFGVIGIGTSAIAMNKYGGEYSRVESLADIPDGKDNVISEYEDHIGDELDELLGMDLEESIDGFDFEDEEDAGEYNYDNSSMNFAEPEQDTVQTVTDFDAKLNSVRENRLLNRKTLVETFVPLLPKVNPNFADIHEIDPESEDFLALETICMKAIANIMNCDNIGETGSRLHSARESLFAYELLVKRVNKVKNIDALASEIEAYMRSSSSDSGVNATIYIEGDYYKIIVSKAPERKNPLEEPKAIVVSLGDIFGIPIYKEYLMNEKNQLPIVNGITELGEVIIEDAKPLSSMMITGKTRSGKSWFVTSFVMSLMMFNNPETVQFIIVDPKVSQMFSAISLMPHVCGLHNEENILDILDDIIEREAPRRKKLLADNKCEEIWALRKKGIMLPILYLIIDEYITVKNSLDKDKQKELNAKIQTLMTQFPSQGLRILIVPHRSQGIVDKTNRTILDYIACVRSELSEIRDTLGLPKWSRVLTQTGDIAMKSVTMKEAMYVKGPALTTSDEDNIKFIKMVAKAFYKMGVEIPDMSSMRIACNRDEEYVKEVLETGNKVIQYDVGQAENINLSDAFIDV